MKLLSIIIPTYNNEKNIKKLIKKVKNVPLHKEIIVVNDCSTDNTQKILKSMKNITVITHKTNQGKGGAVKTGLEHAQGGIFFIQDDDLEYDPNDIPKVIEPILEKKAEIVFGARMLHQKEYAGFYNWGRIFLNRVLSFLLRAHISDPITGSKAFTKKVFLTITPLETNGFAIESEIAAKAIRNGFIPIEIPISYNPRSTQEGKNIRWYHALSLIFTAVKYLRKH